MILSEYRNQLQKIRLLIKSGTKENIKKAAALLEALEVYVPWQTEYLCAKIALLIAQGHDKMQCRRMLEQIYTEYDVPPQIDDILELMQSTCDEGTPDRKRCEYLRGLYQAEGAAEQYKKKWKEKNCNITVDEQISSDMLRDIAEVYYAQSDTVMYFVLMMLWCKKEGLTDCEQYIIDDSLSRNLGYLYRMFTNGRSYTFVLTGDENNRDINNLANSLVLLGHSVIITGTPVISQEFCSDSVQQSIGNAEMVNGCILVHPLCSGEKQYAEVCSDIIEFIAGTLEQDAALIVFAADAVMDELHTVKHNAKNFQRLSNCRADDFADTMAFAWAGDYCRYMSFVYGFDVHSRIEAQPEVDISIVLPVRNPTETLRYTLQTCLKQRYKGNYEILVSDNSDPDNNFVQELCKELDDDRIRYIRTPFVLELSKSFEYAYLNARGEFILSIGSDDAVLPWGLDIIDRFCRNSREEQQVFLWMRNSYNWDSVLSGMRNKIEILIYDHKEFDVLKLDKQQAKKLFFDNERMYTMPMMYINSGFKRSFFKSLLLKTGRLWDGFSQDGYLVVYNAFCNDNVVWTNCPLTIAGLSGNSIGVQSIASHNKLQYLLSESKRPQIFFQLGEYVWRRKEMQQPIVHFGDKIAFWGPFFRLVDMGVISEDYLREVDFDALYNAIISAIPYEDIRFDRLLQYLRYGAKLTGNEALLEKTDKLKNRNLLKRRLPVKDSSNEADTVTGFDLKSNYLTVDASKFGITNIEQAVEFMENIYNIC